MLLSSGVGKHLRLRHVYPGPDRIVTEALPKPNSGNDHPAGSRGCAPLAGVGAQSGLEQMRALQIVLALVA